MSWSRSASAAVGHHDAAVPVRELAVLADVALAALAYRHDVASTVRVRAIVEPWVISLTAGALVIFAVGLVCAKLLKHRPGASGGN